MAVVNTWKEMRKVEWWQFFGREEIRAGKWDPSDGSRLNGGKEREQSMTRTLLRATSHRLRGPLTSLVWALMDINEKDQIH